MTLKEAKAWLGKARKRFQETAGKLRTVIDKLGEVQTKRRAAKRHTKLRHRLGKRVDAYKHRVQDLIRTKKEREKVKNRLAKKVKWLKEHKDPEPQPSSNLGTWDGRTVAGWMVGAAPGPGGARVNWLARIDEAGWNGQLFSGWRSPEYSESLCYNICGAPSCSGLCAGRNSNHSGSVYPAGAIDVDDWVGFANANAQVGGPFHNNLPYDRPHRSVSGY